jgi:hypothetical protein
MKRREREYADRIALPHPVGEKVGRQKQILHRPNPLTQIAAQSDLSPLERGEWGDCIALPLPVGERVGVRGVG